MLLLVFVVSTAGFLVSIYFLNRAATSLDMIDRASESLMLRGQIYKLTDSIIKSEVPLSDGLAQIRQLLQRCEGCHVGGEHKARIEEIRDLLKRVEDAGGGDPLQQLQEEVARVALSGTGFFSSVSRQVNYRIRRTEWVFLGWLFLLLLVLLLFSAIIFRRAMQSIDMTVESTRKVLQGEDLDLSAFKDEFRQVGEALLMLQREVRIREEKLRNWAEQWQRTFDVIEDPIALIDTTGRVLVANRRFREVFGENGVKETLSENVILRGDKEYRVSSYPVMGADMEVVGTVVVARDITPLRELEQRRAQTEKLLALNRMLSGIAHELNNPLSVVVGYAEMLRGEDLSEGVKEKLERIYMAAMRTGQVIRRLFQTTVSAEMVMERLDLRDVVEEAIREIRIEGLPAGVILHRDLRTAQIMGDRGHLRQMTLHLLRNARDAVGQRGEIWITLSKEGADAFLTVSDSGPGIPEAHIPHIFEPFFTTKEVGKGMGLGLTLVHTIVKVHGGQIDVRNGPSGGTLFEVRIPLASS